MKSVLNQTSDDFNIVVVCHEIPEIGVVSDKIKYIQVDFDPPDLSGNDFKTNDGLKEEDKSKKILIGAEYASLNYEPDFLMVVDADDCISNKIVEFANANKHSDIKGWYSPKGFIYKEGSSWLTLNTQNFNTLCGTCIIIRPDFLKHIFQNVPHLLYVHGTIELDDQISLQPLPFPAAVYSMANGENHFMSAGQIKDLNSGNILSLNTVKSIARKLKKYKIRLLSTKIKTEYGLSPVKN